MGPEQKIPGHSTPPTMFYHSSKCVKSRFGKSLVDWLGFGLVQVQGSWARTWPCTSRFGSATWWTWSSWTQTKCSWMFGSCSNNVQLILILFLILFFTILFYCIIIIIIIIIIIALFHCVTLWQNAATSPPSSSLLRLPVFVVKSSLQWQHSRLETQVCYGRTQLGHYLT